MKMNKFTLLFCLLGVFFQVRPGISLTEKDLDDTDLHCIKELGYDKKVILDSFDENNFIVEGNPKMNEFYKCAWKMDKLQSEDGSINISNLQKMVERLLKLRMGIDNVKQREILAQKGTEHCKDVKGNDHGDTCVKMYNCLLKRIGKLLEESS